MLFCLHPAGKLFEPITEGELGKYDKRNVLKRRWWVLDAIKGILVKYTNKNKVEQKGRPINIFQCNITVLGLTNNGYSFSIVTEINNEYLLYADTEDTRDKWVNAIKKCSNGIITGMSKFLSNRGLLNDKYVFVKEIGRGSSSIVYLYTYHSMPFAIKKFTKLKNQDKQLVSPKASKNGHNESINNDKTINSNELKKDNESIRSLSGSLLPITVTAPRKSSQYVLLLGEGLPIGIKREIAILKKVSRCPQITTLYEVIDHSKTNELYLVMEYMAGGPVLEWNRSLKAYTIPGKDCVLDINIARIYLRDILIGLKHLQYHHICHRDIKPENLLLTEDKLHIKLSDFSVSHYFADPKEREKYMVYHYEDSAGKSNGMLRNTKGTYHFLAPETLTGEEFCGYKADLWAVGVTLYVFLFGKLPFWSTNILELFDHIEYDDVTFPDGFDETIEDNKNVKNLILKLLTKNPKNRISLDEALKHPWVIHRGSSRDTKIFKKQVSTISEKCEKIKVDETEVAKVVTCIHNPLGGEEMKLESHENKQLSSSQISCLINLRKNVSKVDISCVEIPNHDIGMDEIDLIVEECIVHLDASNFFCYKTDPEQGNPHKEHLVQQDKIDTNSVKLEENDVDKVSLNTISATERGSYNEKGPIQRIDRTTYNDTDLRIKSLQRENVINTIKSIIALNFVIARNTGSLRKLSSRYIHDLVTEELSLNDDTFNKQDKRGSFMSLKSLKRITRIFPFDPKSVTLPGHLVVLAEYLAECKHNRMLDEKLERIQNINNISEKNSKNQDSSKELVDEDSALVEYLNLPENIRRGYFEESALIIKSILYLDYSVFYRYVRFDEERQARLFT